MNNQMKSLNTNEMQEIQGGDFLGGLCGGLMGGTALLGGALHGAAALGLATVTAATGGTALGVLAAAAGLTCGARMIIYALEE